MRSRTRREVLGLTGLGATVAVSGCLGLFGTSASGHDSDSPARIVPQRAGALCQIDLEALLSAADLLVAADTVLGAQSNAPNSVDDALAALRETYGLDPRDVTWALGFVGERASEQSPRDVVSAGYWGIVAETDWNGDAARSAFRNLAPEQATASTHDGVTVVSIGDEALAVLEEQRVVAGRKQAVEDTIDAARGRSEGVTGRLRTAFDGADGTYARFGAALDMTALVTRVVGERLADALPVDSVQSVSGGLFDDEDERGLRVLVQLNSATDAEQLSAQVDSFVGLVRAQGVGGAIQRYEDAVQSLETATHGKTMTATYRAPIGEFNAVFGRLIAEMLRNVQTR